MAANGTPESNRVVGVGSGRQVAEVPRVRVGLLLTVVTCVLGVASAGLWAAPSAAPAQPARPHAADELRTSPLSFPFGGQVAGTGAKPATTTRLARIPLAFEANAGQAARDTRFLARGVHQSLYLRSSEAVLTMSHATAPERRASRGTRPNSKADGVMRLRFLGANPRPVIVGEQRLSTVTNYFVGNDPSRWRRGVPTFERVRYRSLWPGVDAAFYGNDERLEYDFVVAPGADPGAIDLGVRGARRIRVDGHGDLVLDVGGSDVRLLRPVAYQRIGERRERIESDYVVGNDGHVGVRVGAYDRTRALTIDPVIAYSAVAVQGDGQDLGFGVAVDPAGAAYVTGWTTSTNLGTPSSIQATHAGSTYDAFVAKLNPAGTALEYVTYLGGTQQDYGYDIVADDSGNAYVTGTTGSDGFPTSHAFQLSRGPAAVAFVAKLDASGGALVYSTFLGGSGGAGGYGLALDASRNVYVTGLAGTGFPGASGEPTLGIDAFVAKLNASGSDLLYSTYVPYSDFGNDIAVDDANRAYIAGRATEAGLATSGAVQATLHGFQDAFVAKLDASGSAVTYATYLGGGNTDEADAVAVDDSGFAYVVGTTVSNDFPTKLAVQPAAADPGGFEDAFLSKLSPNGDALVYSTYLGGVGRDFGTGVAVGPSGTAFAAGRTNSPDYPLAASFGSAFNGSVRGFLTQLTADGSSFVYSTPSDVTDPNDLAIDSKGYAYLSGYSSALNTMVAKYPSDVAPPETTIVSGPPSSSTSNTASLTFSTSEPGQGSSFECQLDGSPFAVCTSPKAYSVLFDGSHTFRVRAIDEARNVDASPASYTWTVAADPPDTSITGNPPSVTNTTAAFAFEATRAGSTFECRLDTAAFAPCVSPQAYSALSGGDHTFRVRATDGAGETDTSPAAFTWTVDVTPPDTFISAQPLLMSADSVATFEFGSTDQAATLECRLDDAAFASCTSPVPYVGLGDGPHTFRVRSTDAVGNVDASPAQYTWTVETSRPETTITTGPAAASASASATIAFMASEPATFECRLDAQAFSSCTSPHTLAGLEEGSHTFAVRATDVASKPDLTPASVSWTVDLTPPAAFDLLQPAADAANLSVNPGFAWSATTDALTGMQRYELWIDGILERSLTPADCAAACSAVALGALGGGAHRWQVRAFDVAENARATPLRSFSVDATAPASFLLRSPVAGASISDSRPRLTWDAAADAGSGIDRYEVRLDGAFPAAVPADTRAFQPAYALADGSHTWSVVAVDLVGNRSDPQAGSFAVDTTPPVAMLAATPRVQVPFAGLQLDASASADSAGPIHAYAYDLDGDGTFETAAGPTMQTNVDTPGVHVYRVRVTDAAGNIAVASVTVTGEAVRQGPKQTLSISIDDGAFATNSTTATLTITTVQGVRSVIVNNTGGTRGGKEYPVADTSGLMIPAWPLASDIAGRTAHREVHLYAYNSAGRQLGSDEDGILFDASKPVISKITLSRTGKGPRLHIKATDRISGVARIRVKASGRVIAQRVRDNRRPIAAKTTLAIKAGVRAAALTVEVTDRAGNTRRGHLSRP